METTREAAAAKKPSTFVLQFERWFWRAEAEDMLPWRTNGNLDRTLMREALNWAASTRNRFSQNARIREIITLTEGRRRLCTPHDFQAMRSPNEDERQNNGCVLCSCSSRRKHSQNSVYQHCFGINTTLSNSGLSRDNTRERCNAQHRVRFTSDGVPIILRNGVVVRPASDYLIIIAGRLSKTTVRTYAEQLRSLLQYMSSFGLLWNDIYEHTLEDWRDKLLNDGLQKKTINSMLGVVFSFYRWAEQRGHCSGIVRLPGNTSKDRSAYRLSVCWVARNRKLGVVSDLLFKTVRKSDRHTPTEEEIERVKDKLYDRTEGVAYRDTMVVQWMNLGGLRRREVVHLRVGDLPPREDAVTARSRGDLLSIKLIEGTKGNKTRTVLVPAILVVDTWDLVTHFRNEITARRNLDHGYIFVSFTTGAPLSSKTVTNTLSRAFKAAGIVKASGHRLRAAHFTRMVEAHFAVADATGNKVNDVDLAVLLLEQSGWADLSTARHYINVARVRRIQQSRFYKNARDLLGGHAEEGSLLDLQRRRDKLEAVVKCLNEERHKLKRYVAL
ncbi:MAG TPA: tyrosine-type recombinase/integrase [Noviherbaspirillum sp.]|nr:tyrosine-type recombinase/integrase [Noviherbaspirillum sp.]